MIILGLDPGIADAGYGVISFLRGKEECLAYGSIQSTPTMAMSERLAHLYDELTKLIVRYKPDAVAIEKLFFSKNVKTAFTVSEARGVIRLCFEKHHLSCHEFSPQQVKMAVCGHGAASKPQMQKMVQTLLRLKRIPKPDDAADALALALAMAHTKVFR